MAVNYYVRFEKPNATRIAETVLPNNLWLDYGEKLEMGCIVHNKSNGYQSTFHALVDYPKYLRDIRSSAQQNETVIIHAHTEPNLDSSATVFAVEYYLEHGEKAFSDLFCKSKEGKALVCYIDEIISGRGKNTGVPTLYAIFCAMDDGKSPGDATDRIVLQRGMQLISFALEQLKDDSFDLINADLSEPLKSEFGKEIDIIHNYSFEADLKTGAVTREKIYVWKKLGNGKLEPVHMDAAIWHSVPNYPNSYDRARKDGCTFTVVPSKIKGSNGADSTWVTISVDPKAEESKGTTLRPLAEILEQMEQMEEQSLFEQTGNYRRDHSQPRKDHDILLQMPFAATSDPWFIKPDESLFASPKNSSLLNYEDILEVTRNNGSAIKKAFVFSVGKDDSFETDETRKMNPRILDRAEMIPISAWQERVRRIREGHSEHTVIWTELDASLIRHNNRILEAYCMNLIGRPLHEKAGKKLYYADYHTCIYSDPNYTVILVATHDKNSLKELPIASFAGLHSVDTASTNEGRDICESDLLTCIKTLYTQREKLLEFGKRIGKIQNSRKRDLERLNTDILVFSAKAQQEDMIRDPFRRAFYQFVKEQFGIDELKRSVMEEMALVVDESRNRLVSRFNILSAFAVPFVLIATVFQTGIIRFDSILNLTGNAAYWGWGVAIVLTASIVMMAKKK